MISIAVLSSDSEINEYAIEVCEKFRGFFVPILCEDNIKAIEILKYDLPDLVLINISDKEIDSDSILDSMKQDPWLHYGGVLIVHKKKDEEKAEALARQVNSIGNIQRKEFITYFYRALKLVLQNKQILFQRHFQEVLLGGMSGELVMENDPFDAKTYSNLVSNFLYNAGYITFEKKQQLVVILFELLINAIEHGNCRIDYEEKTKWLMEKGDILSLIQEKKNDPEIRRRRVYISYEIGQKRSVFTIQDEGDGFDWQTYIEKVKKEPEFSGELHGHGIRMALNYSDNISFNESGNTVSFSISHDAVEKGSLVPGIFSRRQVMDFNPGEVVFSEGEPSNYLYYIVSGKLDVYSEGQYLSSLTPADMFLGEMSFLLNNRRTATVIAREPSRLIQVSKQDFVNAIKNNPHYGIFLSRLIAQRLNRLNSRVARLGKD
ncbi:cyclic nucleotide-binding domain-containing protein [Spirochaetia bacterium 38H-sp]|uniref:Cyclic nucleotide-binding domain-containing protein n=1 Tax=Rarispira pelagica TaxID=3141764 RepID=A0ABU9UBH9_9SPIR